jgi:hypothetical protein
MRLYVSLFEEMFQGIPEEKLKRAFSEFKSCELFWLEWHGYDCMMYFIQCEGKDLEEISEVARMKFKEMYPEEDVSMVKDLTEDCVGLAWNQYDAKTDRDTVKLWYGKLNEDELRRGVRREPDLKGAALVS